MSAHIQSPAAFPHMSWGKSKGGREKSAHTLLDKLPQEPDTEEVCMQKVSWEELSGTLQVKE